MVRNSVVMNPFQDMQPMIFEPVSRRSRTWRLHSARHIFSIFFPFTFILFLFFSFLCRVYRQSRFSHSLQRCPPQRSKLLLILATNLECHVVYRSCKAQIIGKPVVDGVDSHFQGWKNIMRSNQIAAFSGQQLQHMTI